MALASLLGDGETGRAASRPRTWKMRCPWPATLGDRQSEAAAALRLYPAAATNEQARAGPRFDAGRAGRQQRNVATGQASWPHGWPWPNTTHRSIPRRPWPGMQRALRLAEELGDRAAQAEARYGLASLSMALGDTVGRRGKRPLGAHPPAPGGRQGARADRAAPAGRCRGRPWARTSRPPGTTTRGWPLARELGDTGAELALLLGLAPVASRLQRAAAGGRLLPQRAGR